MSSHSRSRSLGLPHLPDASVIDKVEEDLEVNLPEGYKIEATDEHIHAEGYDLYDIIERDEDITYFVTDPNGHEVADIGFLTLEVDGKKKVASYRTRTESDDSHSKDQAYGRLKRFVEDILHDTVQSGVPERQIDEDEIDKLVVLNYEGERQELEEAEMEQFQKAVQVLEETDRAYIDPEWSDRDIFYNADTSDHGSINVVTDDYQDLLNFMRNTELYVEASGEPQ